MCMMSRMIRPLCEITDQLAVGTQNCFSTLFYTPYTNIKTSAQNAPKCTNSRQKIKKFSGDGAQPPPQTPPLLGRGITPTPPLSARSAPRFSRLGRSAFPFLFIYDSNTARVTHVTCSLPCNLGSGSVQTDRRTTAIGHQRIMSSPYGGGRT